MKLLAFILVCALGCLADNVMVHPPAKGKSNIEKSVGIPVDTENENGVHQKVVYGYYPPDTIAKFWLDTWVQTNKGEIHKHYGISETFSELSFLPIETITITSSNGTLLSYIQPEEFPYDTLTGGSFEFIKSIKAKMYQKATTFYNNYLSIKKEEARIKDSTMQAVKIRKDSAKILNDLQ